MGKKRKAIKQVEKGDVAVSRAAARHRESGPVQLLGWFGKLTDQPPLFAFAAGIVAAGLIRRDPRIVRTGARMALAHWLGMQGKEVVKHSVDRTRPQLLIDEGRHTIKPGDRRDKAFTSFPSGHTAGAVAIACALARDYGDHGPAAYGAAATAATARIAECDHFLSDTLAGAAIGAAAEIVADAALGAVQRLGRQAFPSYS